MEGKQVTLGSCEPDGSVHFSPPHLSETANKKQPLPGVVLAEVYKELDRSLKIPKCSNMEYDARVRSFKDCWSWKKSMIEDLAKDGFYSVTSLCNNITKCYYCGVQVYNWNEYDDVTVEHLVWSKRIFGAPCPQAAIRALSRDEKMKG